MTALLTARNRPRSQPVAVPVWIAAGVLLAVSAGSALAVAGLAVLVFLVGLGSAALVPLLVGATFVSGLRFDLFGAAFRPEHVVLPAALAALVIDGHAGTLVQVARDRTAVLLGLFVGWSGFTSVIQAEDPAASLLIVGWLALDWMILVVLVAWTGDPRRLAGTGASWAGAAAGLALALWASAHLLGSRLGVTTDTVTGALAATGLFHEANILGTTMAAWAFLAVTCSPSRPRLTRLVVVLTMAGVLVSLTRAAAVGLAAGLVTWALIRGPSARRTAVKVVAFVATTLVALALTAPGVVRPVLAKSGQVLNFGENTGQVRLEQWKLALDDIDGTAWLMGLGTNSFGQRHLEPTLPDTPTPAYHGNLLLQVLYDTGLIGVGLLAGAVLNLLTPLRLRDGRALGLLVTYTVGAVATSSFWFGSTWVLVAIALADRRRLEEADPDPAAPSPVAVTAGAGP